MIHKCTKRYNLQSYCISNIYDVQYHMTCMTLRVILNARRMMENVLFCTKDDGECGVLHIVGGVIGD